MDMLPASLLQVDLNPSLSAESFCSLRSCCKSLRTRLPTKSFFASKYSHDRPYVDQVLGASLPDLLFPGEDLADLFYRWYRYYKCYSFDLASLRLSNARYVAIVHTDLVSAQSLLPWAVGIAPLPLVSPVSFCSPHSLRCNFVHPSLLSAVSHLTQGEEAQYFLDYGMDKEKGISQQRLNYIQRNLVLSYFCTVKLKSKNPKFFCEILVEEPSDDEAYEEESGTAHRSPISHSRVSVAQQVCGSRRYPSTTVGTEVENLHSRLSGVLCLEEAATEVPPSRVRKTCVPRYILNRSKPIEWRHLADIWSLYFAVLPQGVTRQLPVSTGPVFSASDHPILDSIAKCLELL